MSARDERTWVINGASLDLNPGFYKMRLAKDAAFVPVRLEAIAEREPETGDLMADVEYRLTINGEAVRDIGRRYPNGLIGVEITEAEYKFMDALRQHAERYEPDHPAAQPYAAIDLMTVKPPF